jgi:hypothetical protein
MKNLKKVKTGDVIDTSIKDRIFIKSCFEQSVEAERSAQRFMSTSLDLADKAWKNIKTKWPELAEFEFTIDHKNECIIVKERSW